MSATPVTAFQEFIDADDALPTLASFEALKAHLNGGTDYPSLSAVLVQQLPFKFKSFFEILNKAWHKHETYRLKQSSRIVISGAGPCGLMAAVHATLCGHHVTLLELRTEATRHNILKTWPCTVEHLMQLGVGVLVPTFKPHGHLHIGTRELQVSLLKVALLFGAHVQFGQGVCGILQEQKFAVWTLLGPEARTYLRPQEQQVSAELALRPGEQDVSKLNQSSNVDFFEHAESLDGAISTSRLHLPASAQIIEFESLLVAEGESSRLIRRLGFDRKITRFNEAIGIVVNLNLSPQAVKAGSGEKQLQQFVVWKSAADWRKGPLGTLFELGIDLENMEYMRGTSTHFIAATTKLRCLKKIGVVGEIRATVRESLGTVDLHKLQELGHKLADVAGVPREAPLAVKHGVQVFDFSCRGVCTHSWRKLAPRTYVLPLGDTMQNPYWPQGLGINRGFHNAIDAVWAAHLAATGADNVTEERDFAFRLMEWKTFSAGQLISGKDWQVDPMTRYNPDLVKSIHMHDIEQGVKDAANSSIPKRYRNALSLNF